MEIKIKSGDTLGAIAKAHGTTVDALAKANGIEDVNKIKAGASLTIPGQAKADSPRPKDKPTPSIREQKVTKAEPNFLESMFGSFLNEEKVADKEISNSSHFFSEVLGVETDHAELAVQQVALSMAEKLADTFGVEVPDFMKPEITAKNFSPAALSAIKDAVVKAVKNDRPTIYEDYRLGNVIDGNKRAKLGKMGLFEELAKSFKDPAMAAGLSIGQSSGVSIDERGHVMLENDVYDFPKMPEGKDDDWLNFNSLFGPDGAFSVRSENSRKINIDLGPLVSKEEKATESTD